MLNAKRLLLLVIASSAVNPFSIDAYNSYSNPYSGYGSNDALLVVAGVALAATASFGIYKLCEWSSFKSAQQAVTHSQDTLYRLQQQYQTVLSDQQIVLQYKTDTISFNNLMDNVSQDLQKLHTMKSNLQGIINFWSTTSYSASLVAKAEEILSKYLSIFVQLNAYNSSLKKLQPIVLLESMLLQEAGTTGFQLIEMRQTGDFERILTAMYAQSQWPFLQAHQDLNNHKRSYENAIDNYTRGVIDYLYDQQQGFALTIYKAREIVAAYNQAQQRIVSNQRYTEDQRYKQKYDDEQERLRIERERLEAARREARAAEQQAQAARDQAHAAHYQAQAIAQQNIQQLQNRLLELRIALNNTKAEIENNTHPYDYDRIRQLQRNYNLLRQEAISIRNKLYGHPDIIQLFRDVFTTTEYV